jgi:single-strand DNA-binding protein
MPGGRAPWRYAPTGSAVGAGKAEDSSYRKGLAIMSQDNQITLRGYLTAEPKLFQKTPTAIPFTEIRVGSTPRWLNRETGEWQDLPTTYYRIKCWRRLAINAVSSLHKGDKVVVRGHFSVRTWVDNQQRPRESIEVEADSLGHDLAYGWTHYMRGMQHQPGSQAGVNAGEMSRQDLGSSDAGDSDDDYPADSEWDEPMDAAPVPESQPDPGGVLVGSGPTSDLSLPDADAVPF